MSDYVIAPPPQPAVPVLGGGLFPVRRVYCIGRNYAAHAREMGGDPTRETPFFFLKPADALQPCAAGVVVDHPYPPATDSYHHEIEMVVALQAGGRDIPVERALACVYGYAVGLDMTRRDRQNDMKAKGWPWEIGKSADASAPIGPIHPAAKVGHRAKGFIRVAVDGAVKQEADLSQMIWSVPEQIAILSRHYELKAGDLIYSGTPEGVGAVKRGQTMAGAIEGLGEITLRVV
ncbi:MAG: fumarylacetoacetate hydrolase family protein [Methylobacteriaceae bacterium]|nr:fumarylacetoacetate hydrolase family protein [Methylobacteriaceae bacterium]